MDAPGINECFRLLKLRRGVDFATVKQAYRKYLYKCHPDRFQSRPEMLPDAERKAKHLIQVYGILEQWYKDNGGIDPVSPMPQTGPGQSAFDPTAMPEEEDGEPERRIPPWAKWAAAGLAACLLVLAGWFMVQPKAGVVPAAAQGIAKAFTAPPPVSLETQPTPAPEVVAALKAAVATRTAERAAIAAERERARSEWIKGYLEAGEAERSAAQGERDAAMGEYKADVQDRALEIEAAQKETDRRAGQAALDSAAAREAFAGSRQAEREQQKHDYNQWLLAQGKEAVALIKEIRKRDNSRFEVFANTEDPQRIFEFWTAAEAGAPEISIAAKTGITILQPDSRYFPHFRSNIYFHDAEGKLLVRMMESIIERHDLLDKRLGEEKLADDTKVANWNVDHPMGPIRLEGDLAQVLEKRDRATDRLAKARARLERADHALDPAAEDAAFLRSDPGRAWAARVQAAELNLSEARRALAGADPASVKR